jgi:release factor glutamine methyltransferase
LNEQGLPSNDVVGVRNYLEKKLTPSMGDREAANIVSILFEHFLGWNRSELALHAKDRLSESEILKLHMSAKEIEAGKPIQHITGISYFYGNRFKVNRHVLIPRPETEELVDAIIKSCQIASPVIVDVGTGSGCISISLKKSIPQATVYALDISPEALDLATINAQENNVQIEFLLDDILRTNWDLPIDILVSNPPYIPLREAALLDKNVKDHEPHLALFVPDDDPLIFYKAIVHLAEKCLSEKGFVALECHENFAEHVAELFRNSTFKRVELKKDMQEKSRMVFAYN